MGYEDEKNPHQGIFLKKNCDAGAGAYLANVPLFKNNNNGPIKVALCTKKRIFTFLGYCYFNLRGGLRGGEGGIWNIKSSIEKSPPVSTLETASRIKRHLSSKVGARIPIAFPHSFFWRT